jgi:hypothetical protein
MLVDIFAWDDPCVQEKNIKMMGAHAAQALLFITGRKTCQIIDDGDMIENEISHNKMYYDSDIL